jgi:predicted enzyme related to lactoylglutathione lyase
MIQSVKFVGIPVHDQDRALAFYTEKLGFKVATDQPMGPQRWIELRIGRADTRFVLFTPVGHADRIGTFFNGALATDDVEATYAELKAKGVEFQTPVTKQPWGSYCILLDSEGNQVLVSESK